MHSCLYSFIQLFIYSDTLPEQRKTSSAHERKVNGMRADQAKEIHLKALLAALGHEPVREDKGEYWYLSPFRQEKDASFKISRDGRAWYDHGAGEGGNILDFAIHYWRLPATDVAGALRELRELKLNNMSRVTHPLGQESLWKDRTPVSSDSKTVLPTTPVASKPESALKITKIQPLQNRALIQYLNRRGIDAATASLYLSEAYYHLRSKYFFALAFANESGGYELRNPYFQGSFAVKDISLLNHGGEGQGTAVALFEGFMDFLSALVYTQKKVPSLPVVILNSASMRHRALAAIQEQNFTEVHLYFDHDKTGRELTAWFQEQLPDRVVTDQSELYAGHKDFNDWLMARAPSVCISR